MWDMKYSGQSYCVCWCPVLCHQITNGHDINGFLQDCSISIANALEILQSCSKLSIYVQCLCKWSMFLSCLWRCITTACTISLMRNYTKWKWTVRLTHGQWHCLSSAVFPKFRGILSGVPWPNWHHPVYEYVETVEIYFWKKSDLLLRK